MPFHEKNSLRYFTFETLGLPEVVHAVFTRHGGGSPHPWNSLNLGGTVGDDPQRVQDNRQRALDSLGLSLESVYDVYQVHGNHVVCTGAPRSPETPHVKADAILTDRPGISLMMRFADCVPIFLYDPVHGVIGIAHAGWQGTLRKTAAWAVKTMQERYGSQPTDILAGIGPSIGGHHYPVGPEVVQQVQETFGENSNDLLTFRYNAVSNSDVKFDLWSANRLVLQQAGVHQVEISGICTACHVQDWYSHRAERGRTGRFGAVIALR